MKNIFKYLILSVIIVTESTLPAQGFDKVGTTAAQFLQIGVGGRITSLGGGGVALIDGPEALYWNPAGIASERKLSVNVYHADWIANLRHQFIGVTAPVGDDGVVGFYGISLACDEFEQTTLTFQEGNGVMVDYADLALGAAYAHRLTDRFNFGATFKYIHQRLFHETASTIAFDLGTHLDTDLPGFSIGMAMTNLGGSMKLEGRDLLVSGPEDEEAVYQVSDWPLPLTFHVGIAWKLLGQSNTLKNNPDQSITVVFDGRHLNEGMTRWHTGVEYGIRDIIFLRAGKVFEHDTEDWTFGGGIKAPMGKYHLIVDFGYADMGDLDQVQRISLGLIF